MTTTQSILCD